MVGPVSLPLAASDSIVEKPVLGSPLLGCSFTKLRFALPSVETRNGLAPGQAVDSPYRAPRAGAAARPVDLLSSHSAQTGHQRPSGTGLLRYQVSAIPTTSRLMNGEGTGNADRWPGSLTMPALWPPLVSTKVTSVSHEVDLVDGVPWRDVVGLGARPRRSARGCR